MLRFCLESHGAPSGVPQAPVPPSAAAAVFSPIRSSNGAAFEEWLLRACMQADGSHLAQQAADASAGAEDEAAAGRSAPQHTGLGTPPVAHIAACHVQQGPCPGLGTDGTPGDCPKKPSPQWSAVLSEASTDSRRTLGLDSSSSEEGERSGSSKLQLRRGRALGEGEGLRLHSPSPVVSRSPLCPAPRPPTPKAPRAGQCAPPLVVGERPGALEQPEQGPEAGGEADSGVGQFLQALVYPLNALAAAAGAALDVVQQVLPLLADDQWADSSDGSQSCCGGDEVEIEERAHARSIQGWGGKGGGKEGAGAGAQAAAPDPHAWEEVLRKRRASRALNRFLDQSRTELCANRLFVERDEAAGARVPLWQRRQWKQPPSLYMTLRSSQAPTVTQNQVMEQLCTPPAPAPAPADAGTPAASPLWQRRASRAPTPLGLKFRKPPPSLGGIARPRTLAVPAA